MPQVCLYFQLHQPYRLQPFNVFNLGHNQNYFSGDLTGAATTTAATTAIDATAATTVEAAATDTVEAMSGLNPSSSSSPDLSSSFTPSPTDNRQVFLKVAQKSYLPMLRLLAQLAAAHPEFTFSLSCSGVFLEQAQRWQPEIINLIANLVSKHQIELLAETYYHSLSFLYSETEFIYQINKHISKIEELFAVTPRVFRNTELIYSNHIAWLLAQHDLQFKGILTEAVDRYLAGRARTQLFTTPDFSLSQTQLARSKPSQPSQGSNLSSNASQCNANQAVNNETTCRYPLLLKHAPLSDDIAFRFSNPRWQGHPLTAQTYLDWLQIYPEHETVNLFMDFETFGEHQWQDTGIFDFFADFVQRFLKQDWNQFVTPSQVFAPFWQQSSSDNGASNLDQLSVYDVPDYISWADLDRDLTAWVGNQLQADALRAVYELESAVLDSKDRELQEAWRRLQTSDHFYYMCTKWSADGDVHAYFSPYDSPLEAYRRYSIVLADLEQRLR